MLEDLLTRLAGAEAAQARLLDVVFRVSHAVVCVEQGCRLDLALMRTLRRVDRMRKSDVEAADLRERMQDALGECEWAREGRLAVPRILLAFHRNPVRQDLGASKKREIYDKLEQAFEQQIYNILKQYRLIGERSSLCYVSDKQPYALLINPETVNTNPFSTVIEAIVNGTVGEPLEEVRRASFSKFVRTNMTEVRNDKKQVYELPTLARLESALKVLVPLMSEDAQFVRPETMSKCAGGELRFMKSMMEHQVDDAIRRYQYVTGGERAAITKAEHDYKLSVVLAQVSALAIGDKEAAVAKVRGACEKLWNGGLRCCEHPSLTQHLCQMPIHSSMGDPSVDASQWQLHNSNFKLVSACGCGHSQSIRPDPFTLKEANYDFYEDNDFECCRQCERIEMTVLREKEEGEGEGELEWDDGVEENVGGGGRRVYVEGGRGAIQDATSDPSDTEDEEGEGEEEEEEDTASSTASEREGGGRGGGMRRPRDYLDQDDVSIREPSGDARSAAVAFAERLAKLKANKVAFVDGVPHSLYPLLPPLYPSWQLTCVGPSSFYSHVHGLREQPGFCRGSEFLLPLDVHLQVDPYSWDRDCARVLECEGVGYINRHKWNRKTIGNERVKLFIGFEYECPRGHRLMMGPGGSWLNVPRGGRTRSAKSEGVEGSAQLLDTNLPIRKPCQCSPTVAAQLMRVHVVTPKAPVAVTLQPKVMVSPDDSGYYTTGSSPLDLAWAKYYILRLPFAYGGARGVHKWSEDCRVEGGFVSGCLDVSYTPMNSWI